jgi:hypothetical protein
MKCTINLNYVHNLAHLDAGTMDAEKQIMERLKGRPLVRCPWCVVITIKTLSIVKPAVITHNIIDALKRITGVDRDPHIINTLVINDDSGIVEIFAGNFNEIKAA